MVQDETFPIKRSSLANQWRFPKSEVDRMAGLVDDGDNAV